MKTKRDDMLRFGKKTDNEYRIIERRFKDESVHFFVEVTSNYSNTFNLLFHDPYIFDESFKSYDKALECVNKLKEEDKKITVLEEIIHVV